MRVALVLVLRALVKIVTLTFVLVLLLLHVLAPELLQAVLLDHLTRGVG